MPEKTIHHGRNVQRFREWLSIKQETLAAELNWGTEKLSLLEAKEKIGEQEMDEVVKTLTHLLLQQ